MKRITLLLILLFVCVLLLSQPIIEFETLEYDFGRIKEEEGPHKVDFEFSNTGDESFHLLDVKAGWGCTAPSWSTDEVKPSQTGIISAQYDSNNRPGSFSKSIKIKTGYILNFSLSQTQKETKYSLNIPVAIYFADDVKLIDAYLNKASESYSFSFPEAPVKIEVDPQFDIFRRLDKSEVPPALSQVFPFLSKNV